MALAPLNKLNETLDMLTSHIDERSELDAFTLKRADYELAETITQTEAEGSISVVDKMLTKIAEMKSNAA